MEEGVNLLYGFPFFVFQNFPFREIFAILKKQPLIFYPPLTHPTLFLQRREILISVYLFSSLACPFHKARWGLYKGEVDESPII